MAGCPCRSRSFDHRPPRTPGFGPAVWNSASPETNCWRSCTCSVPPWFPANRCPWKDGPFAREKAVSEAGAAFLFFFGCFAFGVETGAGSDSGWSTRQWRCSICRHLSQRISRIWFLYFFNRFQFAFIIGLSTTGRIGSFFRFQMSWWSETAGWPIQLRRFAAGFHPPCPRHFFKMSTARVSADC